MEINETTENQGSTEQSGVSIPNETATAETSQEQTEQELQDWLKDSRAETMWKKDPNNMYRSYRSMEKMYTPLKSQTEKINKMFKDHGVEVDQFGNIIKEYKTLKDPKSPANQWLDYIKGHLSGEDKDEVIKFFNERDRKLDQKKYGENLPDSVIERLKKSEELEQRLNQKEEQEKYQAEYNQTVKTIADKLSEVENLAKDYDVIFDADTKSGLLKYCSDNNIDPNYIPAVFSQLALAAVKKSASTQSERKVIENLESSKKAGIVTKSSNSATVKSKPSGFRAEMSDMLSKMGIT